MPRVLQVWGNGVYCAILIKFPPSRRYQPGCPRRLLSFVFPKQADIISPEGCSRESCKAWLLHPTSPNGSGLDCILPPSMGLALPLIFLHGTPRSPARNVAYTGKTLWVKPTPICSPWLERRMVTSLSFRAFPHGETRVVGRRSSVGGRAYLRSRASRFQLCFHSILYRWKDRFPPVTLLLAVVEK